MKKFFILLLLTLSCSSFDKVDQPVEFTPDNTIGCQNYRGSDRISCINELLDILEKIKGSPLVIVVEKEERIDEDTVRVHKRMEISKHLSFKTKQDVYSPSFLSKVKKFTLIALPSAAGGAILVIVLL